MPQIQHSPNTFFWLDLGTTDVATAQAFYAALFDWDVQVTQIEQWTYVKFSVAGKDVTALYQMAAGQIALGYPVAWMPYLWVEDVDHSTAQVKALGGKVLRGPFDVGDQGRTWAVQDPTGATVYLWQPGQHRGAQLLNQPGALSWVELATPNPAQAEAFYAQLLGWERTTQLFGTERYVTFYQDEQAVAGMVEVQEQPPRWRVYFGVKDCDVTTARVSDLGGEVVISPHDIPGYGRVAALHDPQGIGFAIVAVHEGA